MDNYDIMLSSMEMMIDKNDNQSYLFKIKNEKVKTILITFFSNKHNS